MKMNKWYLAVIVTLCVAAGFCLSAYAAKLDVVAKVSSVKGVVEFQKGGKGAWQPAEDGALLGGGDFIRTGSGGSCVLSWMNGNVLKLTPFTNMKIEKFDLDYRTKVKNSELNVWSGKVFAKVDKLDNPSSVFTIKTPSAIAGVRGTKMGVGVGADDSTSVECFDGACFVKGNIGAEVALNAGEKTNVKKDETPEEPEDMDEDDKDAFEAEAEEITEATLEIIQPVGDLDVKTSTIMVKGKTEPGNEVVLTVTEAGGEQTAAADASGNFSAVMDLREGVNHLKITAKNKQGKATTKNRIIKYETEEEEQPPALDITQPPGNVETETTPAAIKGKTTPDITVSIEVQESNDVKSVTSDAAGNFTAAVDLSEGVNHIKITAESKKGKSTTSTRVVKYQKKADAAAPTLEISQPGNGEEFTSTPITVRGTTDPGNSVTIEVSQTGASVSVTADAAGNFSGMADISEGINYIKVTAGNEAGRQKIINRQVAYKKGTVDEGPISLTISSPREGLVTRESTVPVSGSVSAGTDVSIGGIPTGKPGEATTYSGTANLYIEGENQIAVLATRGDSTAEKTVTVIRDSTSAPLTVTQPQSSFYVDGGICALDGASVRCAVVGRTEADATLTINNVRYSVDTDGSFSLSVTLGSNENTIVMIARDPIGNAPTTVILTRIAKEVGAVEVSVNPAQIVADSESAATITVTVKDFTGNPISGAAVTLSATSGGALSSSTLTTSTDGTAAATFTAGVGGVSNTVTITAASGGILGTTTLLLTPDSPPDFMK